MRDKGRRYSNVHSTWPFDPALRLLRCRVLFDSAVGWWCEVGVQIKMRALRPQLAIRVLTECSPSVTAFLVDAVGAALQGRSWNGADTS